MNSLSLLELRHTWSPALGHPHLAISAPVLGIWDSDQDLHLQPPDYQAL